MHHINPETEYGTKDVTKILGKRHIPAYRVQLPFSIARHRVVPGLPLKILLISRGHMKVKVKLEKRGERSNEGTEAD